MDEHDVVEAGTDLLFGDPKSVLKKIGLSILDKKQFEAIFVSAGKTVAEYEKDNTEQNDIRRILFCEETMRLLANEIRKSNSFDWLNDLDRCVNDLLSLSELDSINKARCKKHFEDIVIYQIKKLFPQRYGSYCLGDIHDNVNSLMASTQSSNETLNKILELMSQNDGEYNQKSPTTHEDWQDKSSYTLLEWHLERVEVDGIFAHKDSYTDDIIKLTETWQKERDEYPGWYIIPYNTAVELSMYTDENGLLQKHETEDIDVMLDFAYELCWRRIKTMLPYSEYEVFHLRQIWDKYYVKIKENAGGSDKIRKWFYIGQILLSDYRESMNWNEWQSLMDILTVYQDSGNNGKVDLMIERAKACYFKLDIPSLRRELDQCDIPEECYEQRLLVIGLDLECGKLEESLKNYDKIANNGSLVSDLNEVNNRIYNIEKELNSDILEQNKKRILQNISDKIKYYARIFGAEYCNDNILFDIENLTLQFSSSSRKDFLWEIGSGHNFMSYHISTILAIHEYLLSTKEYNKVPSFIVFDQPSQVYFPELKNKKKVNNEEAVLKVKRIFQVLADFKKRTNSQVQVIIIEHAGEATWKDYADCIKLIRNWRGKKKDNALIPEEWIEAGV